MISQDSKLILLKGMRAGIPIGLGYFAVCVSLGLTARAAGFTAFQGFLFSMLNYASAGQYAGAMLYAACATLAQVVSVIFITNARYMLMGVALNQRVKPETSWWKRLIIGATITDEIFGVTIARPGYINYLYPLGAWLVAVPMWSAGMSVGIIMGNILPARIVSALSVALYGMFLAIIIPPARKDKIVGIFVAISFVCAWFFAKIPALAKISAGNRTIILTVVIAATAAILFPVKEKEEGGKKDAA